jgi:hypothetical protein
MNQIHYQGPVANFRAHAIPLLRRCAFRGWTIPRNKRQIQHALFRARLMSMPALRGPKGAA